jgi:transcription elongation factor S-II
MSAEISFEDSDDEILINSSSSEVDDDEIVDEEIGDEDEGEEYIPEDEEKESDDESEVDEKEDNIDEEDEEIHFESEDDEGGDEIEGEEDFEEGGEGIDINEVYDEVPKKTAKAVFNRRKRTKPPKVSKVIKKKKRKNQEDEFHIQNFMIGDVRQLSTSQFKKLLSDEKSKTIERSIYNFVVRSKETSLNRKLKKSEIDEEEFRTLYTSVVYEYINLISNKTDHNELIKRLEDNKSGLRSYEFRDEKFIDDQETKNIEHPPRAKPSELHKCNKCWHNKDMKNNPDRGKNTYYYELQTRSSDEPMTVFVQCLDCKAKWRC